MFCVITARTQPALLELGEHPVPVVRLGGAEHREPPAVELPDLRRVRKERVDRRVLLGSYFAQIPVGERKSGMPDLGADAGAGQDDAGTAVLHQLGEAFDAHSVRRSASVDDAVERIRTLGTEGSTLRSVEFIACLLYLL